MFAPAVIILGALIVLFVILSQLSYPILLTIYLWCTPDENQPPVQQDPVFEAFSSAYTSMLLYFIMVLVSSKRNLHAFIRLNSLSAIFFFMFVIVISGLGAYAFSNTQFQIGTTGESRTTIWNDLTAKRTIVYFTADFAPLAALLSTGFYLHTCAVPIMRSAK